MRLAIVALAALFAGCGLPTQTTPSPPTQTAPTPPTETSAPTPTTPAFGGGDLRLEPFASGFSQPVLLVEAPDDSGRLFVVEQGGLVKLIRDGGAAQTPFLDITTLTSASGEQGLLGFAFHPDFAKNGVAIVSYTDNAGDSVLARYRVDAEDPDRLDPASAEVLLQVDQPYANHNGGHVVFGPDGFLYYGLGDGGAGGDPHGNGQDPDALLGSLLRLDVGASGRYQIPDDNPFVDGGGRAEVWAKGLRNPWRFSFDRETDDLYVADVGQGQWEEVSFLPRGAPGGANFGWNAFEGTHRYSLTTLPFSPVTGPVAEYSHDDGCSVTGGFVLRGPSTLAHRGAYVFADYCSGKVWLLTHTDGAWDLKRIMDTEHRVSSFGEDAAGDVYLVDHGGSIFKLAEG